MKFFATLLMILGISCCFAEDPSPTNGIDDPNISIFVEALQKAGLNDIFTGTGPFTAFVPSNTAFGKMDQKRWAELQQPEKRDQLTDLLLHHIVHGKYLARNLKKPMSIKPLSGKALEVSFDNGTINVNNAKITRGDLVGPNGVVHEIDAVLIDSQ